MITVQELIDLILEDNHPEDSVLRLSYTENDGLEYVTFGPVRQSEGGT